MSNSFYGLEKSPTFVPPKGPAVASPTIAIVGEQATKYDLRLGEPFSSPAAKLLFSCLRQAGLNTQSLYYTYALKDMQHTAEEYCIAPKSRRQSPGWSEKGSAHIQALRRELEDNSCQILTPLGNVALAALTGRWGINKWRGSILEYEYSENGYKPFIIPTLHPLQILRAGTELKYLLLNDLQKVREFLENGCRVEKPNLPHSKDLNEALAFLRLCYKYGQQGTPIAFDIEIKNLELNCISFAYSRQDVMCIPLVDQRGDRFSPPEEARLMRAISAILSSRSIRKVGQNLIFDTHFLLRRYGIRTKNIDDTMVAHHTLLPQLQKGLDLITSLYTNHSYYKDEGKEWMKGYGSYEQLWRYNCLDSLVVADSFPKIARALVLSDNMPAYERQLSIIEPCCYMMERGVRVDIANLRQSRIEMEAECKSMRAQLEQLAPGLNVNSPKQLIEYFYVTLGNKAITNKQHKITADSEALKKLIRRDGKGTKEARLILEIKKREKLISTYLTDIKFDEDNRVRCSYNPAGTTYSRLSSSKSIFGSGMNLQNWPHSMLRFLTPDEGYVAYTMDLSQAENRIVAYVGRVEPMIHAFETGKDVHRLTASLIFNKSPEQVSDEPGSCTLGNGESTERQWGKKANHGLNYDLGYKNFAILYDMSEKDAKFIVEKYHEAYPEIRRNYHGYIKDSLHKSKTVQNLLGRKTLFLSDLDSDTFKAGYSCLPQGTVGDIMNERGLAYIYHNPKLFGPVELLMQVHDSITFQIPLAYPWEQHAEWLQLIKNKLETPLVTHYGREFTIPVDTVMGLNLKKEDGIELKAKNWPSQTDELASLLRSSYAKLVR